MTDVNISPVTESEMGEFRGQINGMMERFASMVVSYSRQAGELEFIRQQVTDLHSQLSTLRDENIQLRKDKTDSEEYAKLVENDKLDLTRKLQTEQARATHFSELIISNNTRVGELNTKVKELEGKLLDTGHERDTFRQENETLHNDLQSCQKDRDDWKDKATKLESDLSVCQVSLARVKEVASAIFGTEPKPEPTPEPVKPLEPTPEPTPEPSSSAEPVTADAPKEAPPTDPVPTAETIAQPWRPVTHI